MTPTPPPFSLTPLVFLNFATTMAMMSFTALAGPIGRTLGLAPWQMGLAVTVGGLAWVLTARAWGKASDRHGRRPTLLIGMGGFALSYAALCVFTILGLSGALSASAAFVSLLLWRGLCGVFYAAVPATGPALVADHVPPDRRAAAMATLGMAGGISMVIGPAAASLLSTHSLSLPLQVSALLPLASVAILWTLLPRRESPHTARPDAPPRWSDPRLRRPLGVAFLAMFSVSVAQIVVGFYVIDRLGLSPQDGAQSAGFALTAVGIALTLSQMTVRSLTLTPAALIAVGTCISAVGFGSVAWASSPWALYGSYFVAATGMGLIWPSIPALTANAVGPHEQGAAAGTVSAAQGLGTILGPLAGTAVYAMDHTAPYLMVCVLLLILCAWMLGSRPSDSPTP